MADDGGSSGRLRRELGIVPPGDVRNCLAALAAPEQELWAELLGYRFEAGEGITGHALGNLILAALTEARGSFQQAVALLTRQLDLQGEVLPSTYADVTLRGFDRSGEEIYGQDSLRRNPVAIADVKLTPEDVPANPRAIEALCEADIIVIAPGSLYTSIIPNLLVPDIAAAIRGSKAQVVYFCNVANMLGETAGFMPPDYLDALDNHGLSGRVDLAVLSASAPTGADERAVWATPEAMDALRARGVNVMTGQMADTAHPLRHSVEALTDILAEIVSG
jgi:uncharacterized cofD-like protein